jgi:hypothetical protein
MASPGFEQDFSAGPPPPPPGFEAEAAHESQVSPDYGAPRPMHTSEAFGDAQDVTSLIAHSAPAEHEHYEEDESRFLAGTGTDRTNYSAVPPITPDFFARSSGKGRR